jgi:hypothetical protein
MLFVQITTHLIVYSNRLQLYKKVSHLRIYKIYFLLPGHHTGQNKRIAPLPFFHRCRKILTELTPEIDCDQTAMDLPPTTSAVFLIAKYYFLFVVAKSFWLNVGVSKKYLRCSPSGIKREWYVFSIFLEFT